MYVSSFLEGKLSDPATQFYSDLAYSYINHDLPLSFNLPSPVKQSNEEISDKIHRMSYNEIQNYFLMQLKNLALQMKDIDRANRKNTLKDKVH